VEKKVHEGQNGKRTLFTRYYVQRLEHQNKKGSGEEKGVTPLQSQKNHLSSGKRGKKRLRWGEVHGEKFQKNRISILNFTRQKRRGRA